MFGNIYPPSKLTQCKSVEQLYTFLHCDPETTSNFLYSNRLKYRLFTIPKKNGNTRIISAPIKKLKEIQYKIKEELEKYYKPKKTTHGFICERSIKTNAKSHVRKEFVLNIDLKDFFDTINFGRVKGLFEGPPLNLSHGVASVLAHICCNEGKLPQGAPTSPIISNMIAYKLDIQLRNLAIDNSCSFTRYADDISFSFTNKIHSLPKQIVFFNTERKIILGNQLLKIIKLNGFDINEKKTRIQHRTQRQSVTNVTVNEKLNINKRLMRSTSALLNAILKYGPALAEKEHFEKYYDGYISERHKIKMFSTPGKLILQKVRGKLNFIRSIRGENCDVWRKMMYNYTLAIGVPNETYNKSWLDVAAESTIIINNFDNFDNFAQGSGFLLKGIGLITNHHVIEGATDESIERENLEFKWLVQPKNKFIFAKFISYDKQKDIAIIDLGNGQDLIRPLLVEPAPNYEKNTTVYTIGYPNHHEGEIATIIESKIINKLMWHGEERIIIDKLILHGTSGGVVLNTDGKVIGIVSNGNEQGKTATNPNGFIPISTLIKYYEELSK
ncbi:reverse transcriptase domain-containing protein [Pseudoalteromonas sp. HL-AS2]|uniref:reverse transcriptase domain-containing protein n=1 Tax=Pseudoalteromonas sp. HL-AS2 TaxID=3071082 RepID=UPI00281604F4|nr:reverse transcriptase domain-containing protein [Pseudoalteromonas sp. HL-AS2]WMS93984.1 reverse transcriptase domain-containing protein [Pseudoalteromonas sp. HL-AS2]